MPMNTYFEGDFEFLPVAAHLHFAAVPVYPTEADFHGAVSDYQLAVDECPIAGAITKKMAAARWRIEAIRARRGEGYGKPLDLPSIVTRTATALHQHATEAA